MSKWSHCCPVQYVCHKVQWVLVVTTRGQHGYFSSRRRSEVWTGAQGMWLNPKKNRNPTLAPVTRDLIRAFDVKDLPQAQSRRTLVGASCIFSGHFSISTPWRSPALVLMSLLNDYEIMVGFHWSAREVCRNERGYIMRVCVGTLSVLKQVEFHG